ncbi:MAG: Arylmalonate decarboxylase [Alphaproteobacteria bacterium MarineAlpha5_Bin11]|mgnify:CR=1 FL=1|nr:arylmalonate decarboxylase [Pelagibacteraceae bacterium]PPR44404.1 MAG: Arylmalonate decarboxylase [Alphaproteobacteria bacterium MarineAlpha5_Bin11]PPR50824.1 MAG: Arylmalonate decarboxylase [Alphaproteobacteria bacterium MarineAlpha5_Bin10]|tara:strand:+ start:14671 stop:15453 length:783 start_codon:yes stop_codon:yes gene_type:complete
MYKTGDKVVSKTRNVALDEGKHHRAKLGFIFMSTDLAGESDIFNMAPEDVGIHITRLKTDDNTTNETLSKHIDFMADAASRIQPDTKPDVISYSCTSGSIVIGEDRVMQEIKKGAPYAIPMTLVTGVVDALRELNVKKLVVGTPYIDEINTSEAEFLTKKKFEVLDIQGLNLNTGVSFGQVTPEYWKNFALEIDRPDADAIFLSCGGIRSLEVVEEIENVAKKPVITSNQAQMWSCLRRAGVYDKISGFGRIFNEVGKFN